MNQPDRFELYLLGPGQKKLNIVPDPVIPNACLVTVEKEDHTLGNLLRGQLLRDPRVTFVGYRLPHPLVNALELRIQTKPDCDVKTCLSDA
ncbi:RBP11-like subunits of RNA polymerase, partial [Conidiobolus coronatus NRRL 28638]